MPNQNKPTPPLSLIEPHIRSLWKKHSTDKQIVAKLHQIIDTDQYGIGLTKFIEICKGLRLYRTRQQAHTPDTIRPVMTELHEIYPNAGVREMISLIFHEHDMAVSRNTMQSYFASYKPPELLWQCKANGLRRRRFWAAGVKNIWAVDQHDKWLRHGLALHTGVEPFSGRILWMKIWHSNCNSQLILSYYLEVVEKFGFIPMVTQSDPGTENFGIANAQTFLRQMQDPTLQGFVQHRWMHTKKNIVPEIAWSQLRRHFAPGFKGILDHGVNEGWYDPDNTLQLMVFRWVFIPWLQSELDAYRDRINNTRKRCDRNKVLPHGVPELIHENPEEYGSLDFKVMVSKAAINEVRCLYINGDHTVFDLIPAPLNHYIEQCYDHLGRPQVGRMSAWTVYLEILDLMRQYEDIVDILGGIEDIAEDSDPAILVAGADLHEVDGYIISKPLISAQ
ncbi:hypothetical protein L210DRAFT_3491406 [Boletus edulis BED1]|uniref:Integrase core domain-containing protein n=1 Tax=Boletus edulis BED1 TaxID=1328754 RepID=A0AAD4BDR8_BOLED|nr:hypothetical protein L210DRAFT_3491406 [Boletus edulis BED1]